MPYGGSSKQEGKGYNCLCKLSFCHMVDYDIKFWKKRYNCFGNCHFVTWLITTSSFRRFISYYRDIPKLIGNLAKSLVKEWKLILSSRQMMINMMRLMTKKELIQVERKKTNRYI